MTTVGLTPLTRMFSSNARCTIALVASLQALRHKDIGLVDGSACVMVTRPSCAMPGEKVRAGHSDVVSPAAS
jgi:hypothetical protein